MKQLKVCYYAIHKRNLPVYGVGFTSLKDFATKKKDVTKRHFKMPNKNNLLTAENIFPEEGEGRSPARSHASSSSMASGIDILDSAQLDNLERQRSSGTIHTSSGQQVCLEDFNTKRVIGKGSFGKVFLVEKRDNGELFAMKSLKKDVLLKENQLESTKLEKEILMKKEHPFLVSMEFIFQTESKIYFVMNFVRGGELFKHLADAKRFTEERAMFYAAQIILGIGYLHKQHIIYRDIKPENILMGADGYLYLADFGLAKSMKEIDFAQSFCGTPEYLAPEIVTNRGHNHAVDWWSIGVLIYEMIVGFPPFYHKNQNTMYELIEKFPVRFPDPEKHKISMSDDLKDLLSQLLAKDPEERLGTKGGVEEVSSHPWFSSLDWEALYKKELEPEFRPELGELDDVS